MTRKLFLCFALSLFSNHSIASSNGENNFSAELLFGAVKQQLKVETQLSRNTPPENIHLSKGIRFGYQIHKYVGLEIAVIKHDVFSGENTEARINTLSDQVEIDQLQYDVESLSNSYGIRIEPLAGEKFSPILRVGHIVWEMKAETSSTYFSFDLEPSEVELEPTLQEIVYREKEVKRHIGSSTYLGLGVSYYASENVFLSFEVMNYELQSSSARIAVKSDVTISSIGVGYRL